MLAILGWVASKVLDESTPDWLNALVAGLAAAGVALVAAAALQLVRNICKGRLLQVGAQVGGRGGVQLRHGAAGRGGARWLRRPCVHGTGRRLPAHARARRRCCHPPDSPTHRASLPSRGPPPQVLCTLAAVVAYYWPKPWTFPALIVIGGLVTLVVKRKDVVQVGGRGRAGEARAGQGKGREGNGRQGGVAGCASVRHWLALAHGASREPWQNM